MNKEWILTQESFDAMLSWLAPDREQAGQRYEIIRHRLIKIFTCRGCLESEELADETINRVARKMKEIKDDYRGDPALYFYGVGHKVYLEHLRKKSVPLPPPSPIPEQDADEPAQEYECLEHCVERLPTAQRELVLQYYQEEGGKKIASRKDLASRLGIELNALRIRAFRIRTALQKCVHDCLRQKAA
jgi:DNA-directed RNA polymerase specialized sigma24 family protein